VSLLIPRRVDYVMSGQGFVMAVGSESDISHRSKYLHVALVPFVGTAAVATRFLGSGGLIVANMVNMTVRIVLSCKFAVQWFDSQGPLWASLPRVGTWVTMLLTSGLAVYVGSVWGPIMHVASGAVLVAICLLQLGVSEREFLRDARALLMMTRTMRQREKVA
jgi:hypothetical protein